MTTDAGKEEDTPSELPKETCKLTKTKQPQQQQNLLHHLVLRRLGRASCLSTDFHTRISDVTDSDAEGRPSSLSGHDVTGDGDEDEKSPCLTDSHHLFDAVTKGKIHLTRFILAASSSQLQNSWDEEGRTPLVACCDIKEEGTRDQIVQLLLESGADVNKTDREGRSPLIHACKKRCNDIVRILIHHHNIKPDIEDVYGNTALIYSAAVGNDVATELLTRNFRRLGLQVDHYNKQGNTALHVAIKNGNMNCAKILAQKGRASVHLKDKEFGLTPMEWCLREGYDKDEVSFLKPMTRFYRVAKLATSLSRSRTSVSSFNQESKSIVSPSKSADSCVGDDSKGREKKTTLSRSKSQTVEPDRSAAGGSGVALVRQATVDVPTANHRCVYSGQNASMLADGKSSLVSGMTLNDWKTRKEYNKDKGSDRFAKNAGSTSDHAQVQSIPEHECVAPGASNVSINLEECMTCSSAMTSPPEYSCNPQPYPEGSTEGGTDHLSTRNRSSRLVGLGCSLSITSMTSTVTSLGSSDSSSPNEETSLASEVTYVSENICDNAKPVRSNHTCESNFDNAASEPSRSDTSSSSRVTAAAVVQSRSGGVTSPHAPVSSQARDRSQSSEVVASHTSASDQSSDNPGHGTKISSDALVRYELNTTDKASLSTSAGCPTKQSDNHPLGARPATLDFDHSDGSATVERLQGDGGGALQTQDQYSDAGHNVLSLVTSTTPSIAEYSLQSSPAGQDSRMVSHVCSGQQISQDA